MKLKRIIGLGLAVCMIFTLVACGNTKSTSDVPVAKDTDAPLDESDLIKEEENQAIDDAYAAEHPEEATETDAEEPDITGGWTEPEDVSMTADRQEIFDKAIAGTEYENYKAYGLSGIQVVAGTNYRFLCSDGEDGTVAITVYADLEGNCSVTDVQQLLD